MVYVIKLMLLEIIAQLTVQQNLFLIRIQIQMPTAKDKVGSAVKTFQSYYKQLVIDLCSVMTLHKLTIWVTVYYVLTTVYQKWLVCLRTIAMQLIMQTTVLKLDR